MSDMIGRATAAASNAWHECETCPGEMYVKEARVVARAVLLAALDPEDEALVEIVARAICVGDPDRSTHPRAGRSGIVLDVAIRSWQNYREEAKAALSAIKTTAQGEQRP